MAGASPSFCSMKHLVVYSGLLIGRGKKGQISQDCQRQICEKIDFAKIFGANSGSVTTQNIKSPVYCYSLLDGMLVHSRFKLSSMLMVPNSFTWVMRDKGELKFMVLGNNHQSSLF